MSSPRMSPGLSVSSPEHGVLRERQKLIIRAVILCTLSAWVWSTPAAAQPDIDMASSQSSQTRIRLNIEAVQGVLAVQRLDGWLLYDRQRQNPIAIELVNPVGGQSAHRWFYLIPARGQPAILIHKADGFRFEHVPGRKIEYTDHRSLVQGLDAMLTKVKQVAMEYSPQGKLIDLSRVDAGTVELVKAQGVKVRSSAELVQLAKSLWQPEGRLAHHVAVHHLVKLRESALAYVAQEIRRGGQVTEYSVQQFILRGYSVRGLVGPDPVVAVNANAADPLYKPTAARSSPVKEGDLLLLDMGVRLRTGERCIYANSAWVAYVGNQVPERFVQGFSALVEARDAAVDFIRDRARYRRIVQGYEVDKVAREALVRAGYGDAFWHRTGHSLDTDLYGGGANLDDYETRDTRALLMGAGFSIAPGVYLRGDFGMRSSVNIHISRDGVEVTTPPQAEIQAILAP